MSAMQQGIADTIATGTQKLDTPTPDSKAKPEMKPTASGEVRDNIDIEHVLVKDDPRRWGTARKNVTLWMISGSAMVAGLAANIQNPANAQIEQDLAASNGQISWTLAAFIIIQGNFPLIWSAISEIKGRKLVYVVSAALFIVGSTVVATAKTIEIVIGMRALQAAGSSAAMSISAATLADMFDPHERGTKMGIFYAAPLLGPALGPLIGGGLAQAFNWRADFYFLVILGVIIFAAFLFLFKDTFRRERSLTYQTVLRRRLREQKLGQQKHASDTTVTACTTEKHDETLDNGSQTSPIKERDIEADEETSLPVPVLPEVKLSLKDVNPLPPLLRILRRKNNLAALCSSALVFGFCYSIVYTCARTLASSYNYNALQTGLVLLAFGLGNMVGSILGGRWSDRELARLKAKNGGKWTPEMRLESTKLAMLWLPPSVIGYAWVCEKHVHIAAVCVMLFLSGLFTIWIYTSILAYMVDANMGRSSTAVAANSSFRGTVAFVAAEVAIPLQDAIGDGGLYTLWGGLLIVMELLILLVLYKGGKWRQQAEEREKATAEGK